MADFDVEGFRERERRQGIPRLYNGWLHVASSAGLMGALVVWGLSQLHAVQILEWGLLALVALLGNAAVFFIHRDLLHRRRRFVQFAYYRHSEVHHMFFTDVHIVCTSMRDLHAVLFPLWVVALVLGLVNLPGWFLLDRFVSSNAAWLLLAGSAGYFSSYEIVHSISHLRDDHPLLWFPPFRYMRDHHRLHHAHDRMHTENFNIVYPLADWLAGTLVSKSRSLRAPMDTASKTSPIP